MTALLVSHQLHAAYGPSIAEAAARSGFRAELIALPHGRLVRLSAAA